MISKNGKFSSRITNPKETKLLQTKVRNLKERLDALEYYVNWTGTFVEGLLDIVPLPRFSIMISQSVHDKLLALQKQLNKQNLDETVAELIKVAHIELIEHTQKVSRRNRG